MGEDDLIAVSLPTQKTDHICADCGSGITYMDEVFLLQIERPYLFNGRTVAEQVVDEEGAFQYEPYYFCVKCWEKLYESVRKDMLDELPVEDEYSQFECVCCSSGIRDGELTGTFALGEFHVSERAPNGVRGPHFIALSGSDKLCLYCVSLMNDGYIDMWVDLAENGECTDCIQLRCWRNAGPTCDCRCHHDPPESEEDESPYSDWSPQ